MAFKMFSMDNCRSCEYARIAFDDYGCPFVEEKVADPQARTRLRDLYNATAFPIILRGGDYVGGFPHICKLLRQLACAPTQAED
jgi:glutaredoxin